MGAYISILAIQPPFDIGIDAANHQLFSCNFLVKPAGEPDFLLEDMASLLIAAGLGIVGASLWIGGQGVQFPLKSVNGPPGDGPYTQLIPTGGAGTTIDHAGGRQPVYTFQLIVRGASYPATLAQIRACYLILDGRYEITV